MNGMNFYQLSDDQGILLNLVTKADVQTQNFSDEVMQMFKLQHFKGHLGEVVLIGTNGKVKEVYIGQEKHDQRDAIAHAILKLPEGNYFTQQPLSQRAQVMWSVAQYRFNRYKKRELILRTLVVSKDDYTQLEPEISSIFLARDLINMPANELHPESLISTLKKLAETYHAQFEQWVDNELLEHRFPAVYAVGKAAAVAPRIGILKYGNPEHPHVTIVGKGVCFDSGGLDIKTGSSMRIMKKDMGGAAITLGLAQWLMMKQLPIYLTVIVPAVENAVSSNSYRPGDVLTMRSGLTVEIDNTDAEGRLILADAMAYACEQKPELLIDFATLTGAARVAVGTEISAFFTNDDELANGLFQASKEMHDALWRMPLYKGYASMNDSSIADLSNSTSSSYAGAITAALFLERFVTPNLSWVHFDTMAWNLGSKPGRPEGGEAMALQAVALYLLQRYGS